MNRKPLIVAFLLVVVCSLVILLVANYLEIRKIIVASDHDTPTIKPIVSSTKKTHNNINNYGDKSSNNESNKQKPLSSKDAKILENPIYKRFKIKAPNEKKRVNIVVVIQSAPNGRERRQAVRNTWLKYCVETEKVLPSVCILFVIRRP